MNNKCLYCKAQAVTNLVAPKSGVLVPVCAACLESLKKTLRKD